MESYGALSQFDDDAQSLFDSAESGNCSSPLSSDSLNSPSTYRAIAEQTFTPLSIDYWSSDMENSISRKAIHAGRCRRVATFEEDGDENQFPGKGTRSGTRTGSSTPSRQRTAPRSPLTASGVIPGTYDATMDKTTMSPCGGNNSGEQLLETNDRRARSSKRRSVIDDVVDHVNDLFSQQGIRDVAAPSSSSPTQRRSVPPPAPLTVQSLSSVAELASEHGSSPLCTSPAGTSPRNPIVPFAAASTFTAPVRPKPRYSERPGAFGAYNSRQQQHGAPRAPIVPTASDTNFNLSLPISDLHARSGACLCKIAVLEATAERLTRTSSIEDAIREEHNELKRSDSRNSSLSQRASGIEKGFSARSASIASLSRQNSIFGANSAARFGAYFPAGCTMNPHHLLSNASGRMHSGSQTSLVCASPGTPSELPISEFGTLLRRNGSASNSLRSVFSAASTNAHDTASAKASLAEIAEAESPTALTREAFDQADRAAANFLGSDTEESILASAHQHVEPEFADVLCDDHVPGVTLQEDRGQLIPDHAIQDFSNPRLQLHQADNYEHDGNLYAQELTARPPTADSSGTYDQAFGDFDGVHCDPEQPTDFAPGLRETPDAERGSKASPERQDRTSRTIVPGQPRSQSYYDALTGQQMLHYPAHVPAVLNLPPKLSKNSRASAPPANKLRRSQLRSAMILSQQRDSEAWLPDPLANPGGKRRTCLLMEMGLKDENLSLCVPVTADPADSLLASVDVPQDSKTSLFTMQQLKDRGELRRPPRLANRENRKSHLSELPPQLRASAFFDVPANPSPKIEVKDGSATKTLDSILDASATAPVSAFTNHAFAGRWGFEVYWRQKKKRKEAKKSQAVAELVESAPAESRKLTKRNPSNILNHSTGDPKKRASFLSLLGKGGNKTEASDDEGASCLPEPGRSSNQYESFSDEETSEEDENGDQDEGDGQNDLDIFEGQPTTLLAELQLRKQENKARIQPMAASGMYTTLLELDAVHEMERKQRRRKKINLAWEDPEHDATRLEEEEEDNVPLALMFVAKAAGHGGADVVMNAMQRPLGLLEQRTLEDNERLSSRRDRLQGKNKPTSAMHLLQQRLSVLNIVPTAPGVGLQSPSRMHLPRSASAYNLVSGANANNDSDNHLIQHQDGEDSESEGETLGARKARLAREELLPPTRPLSDNFSSELLGHFAALIPEDDRSALKEEATAINTDVTEEETLGQRRRRLQLDREAREREIGVANSTPQIRSMPTDGANRSFRRLSMAEVLRTRTLETPQSLVDPRKRERRRKEPDAARVQGDHDDKTGKLRAQMPSSLQASPMGASAGGYMAGRFNHGRGGVRDKQRATPPQFLPLQQQMPPLQAPQLQHRHSMLSFGSGPALPIAYSVQNPGMGVFTSAQAQNPRMSMYTQGIYGQIGQGYGALGHAQSAHTGMEMPMGSATASGPGHLDRVERWRHEVTP